VNITQSCVSEDFWKSSVVYMHFYIRSRKLRTHRCFPILVGTRGLDLEEMLTAAPTVAPMVKASIYPGQSDKKEFHNKVHHADSDLIDQEHRSGIHPFLYTL
jgi:hypothetical protein